MTEQQAQSPIDDLFRKTFEELPASAAESGWDTPSDHVWQHVQTNISQPGKGWGIQSIVLMSAIAVTLTIALVWMFSGTPEKPAVAPPVTPVEQPMASPSAPAENTNVKTMPVPKPLIGNSKEKETSGKTSPRNSTEENQAKPGGNAAQPLPGSKTTLPPNSTEAKKKKPSGN